MFEPRRLLNCGLCAIGGMIGGVVGFYLFGWIATQGLYAMILPGALVGLGCGLVADHYSVVRGLIAAICALCLGFYTEWSFFPFNDDSSLSYFVRHIYELKTIPLIMIAFGGLIAYWLGKDPGYAGTFFPRSRPR